MLNNLKSLIVILPIALVVFALAKPICTRFMAERDFMRRRNVWLALTVVAFLSPSFWLYVAIALILVFRSARADPNPVALYALILLVVPPEIGAEIPVLGINALFKLDNFRLLALALLLPVAWQVAHAPGKNGNARLMTMDVLVLAFLALQLILMFPYESKTHLARRAFLTFIEFVLPYFVVSRACTSRQAIAEAMASFCLACAVLAPIAAFESLWGWLLYPGIAEQWGDPWRVGLEFRGGSLRGQASAGHSFRFGTVMAIAFGFWLYLQSRLPSRTLSLSVTCWLWVGLLVSYSRGPWVAGALILFAYLALGPNAGVRFSRALLAAFLAGVLVLLSPIGQHVIDRLPFIGTIGAENVEYRKLLLEIAFMKIWQKPFFGDPLVATQLDVLRQGEGIIDLVNVYALIAMHFGLIGLGFYLAPFAGALWPALRSAKRAARADPDLSLLGASLVACMAGTLFIMAVGGLNAVLEKLFYILIGLAVAYARLLPEHGRGQAQVGRAAASPGVVPPATGAARAPVR